VGKPGELPRQMHHPAFLPVALMGGDSFGNGFDQTSTVRAKDSEDKR
jgi:hypothetical protein